MVVVQGGQEVGEDAEDDDRAAELDESEEPRAPFESETGNTHTANSCRMKVLYRAKEEIEWRLRLLIEIREEIGESWGYRGASGILYGTPKSAHERSSHNIISLAISWPHL